MEEKKNEIILFENQNSMAYTKTNGRIVWKRQKNYYKAYSKYL